MTRSRTRRAGAAAPTVWWIASCANRSDRSPRLAAQAPPCLKSPRHGPGGNMKIERVETFQADAGWRMFSFLKVTTDDGIIGWSEFNESFGSIGLSDVIRGLSPVLIGRDPRRFEQITQHLHVLTRQSRGGLNQQAIAAIENALLDVTGK